MDRERGKSNKIFIKKKTRKNCPNSTVREFEPNNLKSLLVHLRKKINSHKNRFEIKNCKLTNMWTK